MEAPGSTLELPVHQVGLTLIEVICVLVLMGILGIAGVGLTTHSNGQRLQASRDKIVWSFLSAQHRAMRQPEAIQVSTNGSTVDVREDANNDGSFVPSESIRLAGVQYPLTLAADQTVTTTAYVYDRMGRTAAGTVTLSEGSRSVTINVSSTGFVR